MRWVVPVHEEGDGSEIGVCWGLDLWHFDRLSGRASCHANMIAREVLQAMSLVQLVGIDAKFCGENAQDLEAYRVGCCAIAPQKRLVVEYDSRPLPPHFLVR